MATKLFVQSSGKTSMLKEDLQKLTIDYLEKEKDANYVQVYKRMESMYLKMAEAMGFISDMEQKEYQDEFKEQIEFGLAEVQS